MDHLRPKWTHMLHVGLMSAKSECGHVDQNGRLDYLGPFWSSTPSSSTARTPWLFRKQGSAPCKPKGFHNAPSLRIVAKKARRGI